MEQKYELYHHGILGMHWGIRRYQNPDGSLTAAGKKRYGSKNGNANESAREAIENGAKNYSDPVDKIMAVTKDCVSASLPWSHIRKAGNEERMLKAADLGLKAMVKFGYGDTEWLREDSPEDHKNLQEWFLWEDQTIGLPMVADLINQGYTSNQIKKMIDIVNQNRRKWWERHDSEGVSEDRELADAIVFDIHEGNYNDRLKDFADACEQVKKGGNYELYHHGILGMKWGVRRFQNEDGSLTPAGKKRYDFKEVAQKAKNRVKAFGTSKTVKRFAGRSGIGGIIAKTKLAQLGFSVVTYAEYKYLENMGHERLSRLVFDFGNAGAAYLEALGITAAIQRGRKRI